MERVKQAKSDLRIEIRHVEAAPHLRNSREELLERFEVEMLVVDLNIPLLAPFPGTSRLEEVERVAEHIDEGAYRAEQRTDEVVGADVGQRMGERGCVRLAEAGENVRLKVSVAIRKIESTNLPESRPGLDRVSIDAPRRP